MFTFAQTSWSSLKLVSFGWVEVTWKVVSHNRGTGIRVWNKKKFMLGFHSDSCCPALPWMLCLIFYIVNDFCQSSSVQQKYCAFCCTKQDNTPFSVLQIQLEGLSTHRRHFSPPFYLSFSDFLAIFFLSRLSLLVSLSPTANHSLLHAPLFKRVLW